MSSNILQYDYIYVYDTCIRIYVSYTLSIYITGILTFFYVVKVFFMLDFGKNKVGLYRPTLKNFSFND